jgi:ribosomal protein L16 Arg81 hydroxylase
MNTKITIRNEHGEFSVSAPTHESIDEMIDLFALALQVASWHEETINQAFLEKAVEIDSQEYFLRAEVNVKTDETNQKVNQ